MSVLLRCCGRGRAGEGLAAAVARGGGQPVSRTWRRIRTVKALALSVLIFVAFVAAVIVRRRRLDADPFRHSRHEGYPPHLKPGW